MSKITAVTTGRQKPIAEKTPGSETSRLYAAWKSMLEDNAPRMVVKPETLYFLAIAKPITNANTLTMCMTPTASPRIRRNPRFSVPEEIMEQTFSKEAKPAPIPVAA